ncbi:FHA domain-containing protein [Kocuria palustris]|uniref:FHA domain-containing protein n=1 Tax=Kocuria palustris TaxID=71999 RepID=UPI0021A3367F|nr:FHA domain-containing protein [Kocuria palustris]MCT1590281.1 FHA domain-containing protein [Kocuria palustris]
MSTPSESTAPSAGPETTTIQVVTEVLSREANRRLTAEVRAAVEALPPRTAILVETVENGARASRFLLDTDEVSAGRHPSSDVFLDDVTVSRKHAGFLRRENGFELVDQGSLNGTYVNGDRVDSVRLNSGDEVRIGKFTFIYYSSTRTAGQGA